MKKWLALCLTVTFISGCGSKMDANEKNFRAALEPYFEQGGQLCLEHFDSWPAKVFSYLGDDDQEKLIKPLVDLGFVSLLDTKTLDTPPNSTVSRYQLTELGRTYLSKTENNNAEATAEANKEKQEYGKICFGKAILDEVVKWEGPMENGKYQEAIVIYRYKIESLADWAQKPEIQEAYPYVATIIAGDRKEEKKAIVKLTSEGWEVAKFLW